MILLLPLLPTLTGLLVWASDLRPSDRRPSARALGTAAVAGIFATLAVAVWAVLHPSPIVHDVGAGLTVVLELDATARVMAVLVPAIAGVVIAYAAVHEDRPGMARLLGLLALFVAAMLLLVVAADLLLLVVAWELVAIVSWALIGFQWRDASRPARAAHAFHATRFGALGLIVAAAALYADTGGFSFDLFATADDTTKQIVTAGVVLAAVSKSGQLPFSPWLFSAMAGPTPVSALLHSATMVAAGAFTLARLEPVLTEVSWFGPVVLTIGLTTALAGGVVAAVQSHAKKLLAASTSAQYGLMLVAIGAGHPGVAMLHLVVHAVFKSQLFLSAGVAIAATGSHDLGRMRLGRHLRGPALVSLVGAAGLAAVPPLGAGWTKEEILSSGAEMHIAVGVAVAVAGALSALYAARFQLLAWGRGGDAGPRQLVRLPGAVERIGPALLAVASLVFGLLWLPAVHEWAIAALLGDLPVGMTWELVLSLSLLGAAVYAAVAADRAGRLASVAFSRSGRAIAPWFHLGDLSRLAVADPTLRLARLAARFDDRVVDGGVRGATAAGRLLSQGISGMAETTIDDVVRGVVGSTSASSRWIAASGERAVDAVVRACAAGGSALARIGAGPGERIVDGAVAGAAWLTSLAGHDTRRMQTGFVHHQFVVIAIGLVTALVVAAFGR